jgi:hypothetical protein
VAGELPRLTCEPGPANLRHHDVVIGSLRAAGFDMAMAAHAYSLLDSYIMMLSASTDGGLSPAPSFNYVPGVCNIGPAEIARRRRSGHVGLAIGLVVLAGLVAFDAPRAARLILVLPAAVAASGYLQAWFRFCAGFGSRGIFNFGELGHTDDVVDPVARAKDRAKARGIALASVAIGIVVAVGAFVLPVDHRLTTEGPDMPSPSR